MEASQEFEDVRHDVPVSQFERECFLKVDFRRLHVVGERCGDREDYSCGGVLFDVVRAGLRGRARLHFDREQSFETSGGSQEKREESRVRRVVR